MGVYTGNFQADVVDWLEAGEFDLTFNCKPQRFLKSGEESIPYKNHTGTILLNETGQIAKPLLRVYGTGSFRINESRLTISAANVYTDIDCELMDAYKGSDNRNQYVSGTFPELLPGENRIYTESLLDFLYITPRWWVL
jgi:phage-related protein